MSLPRVSFVASHLYPVLVGDRDITHAGGAEVQQAGIIKALRDAGYPVSVITGDFGQADEIEWQGIPISKLRVRGLRGLRALLPGIPDCVAALKRQRADIVYLRTVNPNVASAAWYARQTGKHFVYAGASDQDFRSGPDPRSNATTLAMFRWGLRRADLVIAQNQDQADLVRDNWRRPVELIPNFHAEDHGLPGRFDGPVIFVGALRPVKRPDLFIELARAMPLRRFRLIGGPAPGSEAYARQIQASAADVPNLEFTGFVPFVDVGREFDGAALLVNTSDFEGFPNTFLQAWLRGLPSLSFVRPTDEQGQTGTIAATDLTDMIHRARHLLAAESVWREAADQALRFYQTHHTREAVIGRFANAFERLLAGPRP